MTTTPATPDATPATPDAPKRKHKATYTKDKKKGGYLVRVVGPHAARFAGREVPVTTKAGGEHHEKLERLLWSGVDVGTDNFPGTGEPVALYTFAAKPKDENEVLPF